jgi:hypothetical protein
MSLRESEIAKNIIRTLDDGATRLDRGIVSRLAAARDQALAHHDAAPAWSMAWAGNIKSRWSERPANGLRRVLPLAILILGLMGIVFWQSGNGRGYELADIDARLLTDDLPLDAYLDKGFDSWLKRQSR